MELKEIQAFIKFVTKSGASEVHVKTDQYEIQVRTDSDEPQTIIQAIPQAAPATQPAAPAQPAQPAVSATPVEETKKAEEPAAHTVEIKSPMIGTFYRKPSPDKDLFVNVGDKVEVGQTVCVIEAMKLFNEIESEVAGTIVKVLVDDSSPVEYDQPLFLVEPA